MESSARIRILRDRPDSATGRWLILQLDGELAGRYPPSALHGLHPGDSTDSRLIFLVAFVAAAVAGCGAVRPLEPGIGEVKRMFVLPAFRGQGIARALLAELERLSAERGDTCLRLETGTLQAEAMKLYESSGYLRIPPFGEYVGGEFSVCYEKHLRPAGNRRRP